MATTDEPAFGRAAVGAMSDSGLNKACDLLEVAEPIKRDQLRAAVAVEADRYLRRTKQEDATPPLSRQKAQLTNVKNAAGRLIEEVAKLASNPDAEFAFLYQLQGSRDANISNAAGLTAPIDIDIVRDLVAWLRDGASAPRFLDVRSGPTSRPSLHLFALSLCELFERITGKLATHNPYLKIDYKGVPHSAAGRFVEFIVRLVDPSVKPTQISTAMAYAVAELQRSRTIT